MTTRNGKPVLTPRQEVFVAEYLTDLNATRAAIAAGYSPKSAEAASSRLLRNVKVAAVIAEKQGKRLAKLEITADRVLQGIAQLAFFDIRKLYAPDGSLKSVPELDDETAAALVGIEIEEAYQRFGKGQAKPTGLLKKIKLADRGLNLERLGRHLKLFTDRVEHDAPRFADVIRGVRERILRHRQQQRETGAQT
jgi:phage terminase small subunit